VDRLPPPDLFINDACTGHAQKVGSAPHWTWRIRTIGNDHSVSCVGLDGQSPGQPIVAVPRRVGRYSGGLKNTALTKPADIKAVWLACHFHNI
jgi:hypothetical protein